LLNGKGPAPGFSIERAMTYLKIVVMIQARKSAGIASTRLHVQESANLLFLPLRAVGNDIPNLRARLRIADWLRNNRAAIATVLVPAAARERSISSSLAVQGGLAISGRVFISKKTSVADESLVTALQSNLTGR
jgi:hypothetical protein